jgi:hypothetical protein
MLRIQANLIHKSNDLRPPVCQIEKIIELPQDEFDFLAYNPFIDRGFISENRNYMGKWDGIYHCLLVLDEDGYDGVLIEAEGYNSIRYGAYVSHARDFVECELERVACHYLKSIPPDPATGDISICLEDIEKYTGAEVRNDNVIARMFYRTLQNHPTVADVTAAGDCLIVTTKPAQVQGAAGGLKLRDMLLLGEMEHVYFTHESSGEYVAAEDFTLLTDKGREKYAELLNAAVVQIRPGDQGTEVVLSGIEPGMLMDFAQAATYHIHAESMMCPSM